MKHLFPDDPRLRPATAVKYEEVEQDVPSLPKLRKCASNVYSCEIIKKMELAGACHLPPTPRSPRAPNRIARFKHFLQTYSATKADDVRARLTSIHPT